MMPISQIPDSEGPSKLKEILIFLFRPSQLQHNRAHAIDYLVRLGKVVQTLVN